MQVQEALRTLRETGKAETETYAEAKLLGSKARNAGLNVHVNVAFGKARPYVDLCQGGHCHCRY